MHVLLFFTGPMQVLNEKTVKVRYPHRWSFSLHEQKINICVYRFREKGLSPTSIKRHHQSVLSANKGQAVISQITDVLLHETMVVLPRVCQKPFQTEPSC